MALTQISTGGVKNDAVTAGKIPANAVGSSEIADDAVDQGAIADEAVDEARLQISNAGSNGQFLQKQSGNTGGLTWATATTDTSDKASLSGCNFTGSVGINTSSPVRKLHVTADDTPVARFERDTSDGAIIEIRDTSNNTIASIGSESGDLEISAENSNNLRFAVGTSEKFRVGSSGQLGIGGATYGSSGQVLTSGGASAAPSWSTISSGPGTGEEYVKKKNGSGSVSNSGNNTYAGYQSGNALANGDDYNTFYGYRTGKVNSGAYNTYIGYNAGVKATGSGDTCVGAHAGDNATSGGYNTFIGLGAGTSCTTGAQNTAVGHWANTGTTGSYNIVIGDQAGGSQSPSGNITTTNSILVLGGNGITDFYCADTSISSSDKRDKTDITDFTHGLKWINQLKPVTYRWDKRTWYNEYNEDGSLKTEVTPDGSKKRARQHIGFLAQDVLAIEQADGYASKKDDMLVVNINEDNTAYGLKYERLVPVLVNAIKELSTKVESLETKVAALEAA